MTRVLSPEKHAALTLDMCLWKEIRSFSNNDTTTLKWRHTIEYDDHYII